MSTTEGVTILDANSKDVRVLVLTGYGLNCNVETAYAFRLAGAVAYQVHINQIISGQVDLSSYHILVLGGGFSWGDDHGAGVLEAVRLRCNIGSKLQKFVEDGKLVVGICNGFQALVNLGLLPGIDGDYSARRVALTANECGNFRDAWVNLAVNQQSPCVFTKSMSGVEFPIRHGEGRFFAEGDVIENLITNNQVVLQYSDASGDLAQGKFPDNPNGSIHDIAGICDPTGRVFGLMPHPEAYAHWTNHPDWTTAKIQRKRKGDKAPPSSQLTTGVTLFKNGVEYIRNKMIC